MSTLGYQIPVKMLSYRDCELCICHLDGYQSNMSALLERMAEIEAEILKNPCRHLRIWFNMDDNHLDTPAMTMIAGHFSRFQKRIYKISFIGLHGISRWKFNRVFEKVIGRNTVPKAYFSDAESAKGWLV